MPVMWVLALSSFLNLQTLYQNYSNLSRQHQELQTAHYQARGSVLKNSDETLAELFEYKCSAIEDIVLATETLVWLGILPLFVVWSIIAIRWSLYSPMQS